MMNLETYMDDVAAKVVDCIRESNIMDLDGIRLKVRTALGTGLASVLRNEESELAERQRRLIEEQSDWRLSKERRAKIAADIILISQKRKSIRQAASRYENDRRYARLRALVRKRGHQALLDEFDAQNDPDEPFAKIK